MRREIGRWRLVANVGLVLGVLALAGFGINQVSRRQWRVQPTFAVRARFATIGGLEVGHRVRIQGMDAGVVAAVVPPTVPGAPVTLVFRIDEQLRSLVRADAVARIVSEGVVGAKVVELVPGRPDAPPLSDSGLIAGERPVEVADLIARASASLQRIDAVAAAAEQGLGDLNAIVASVRKGEGSLGKLIQDDEAYRKIVGLSERGTRTLNDVDENMAALKRTWPLSRYFNDRAFFDRDRVLFRPGADRVDRTFTEAELFEPGRAVLSAPGRRRLDESAAWLLRASKPETEVVVAAFTNDDRDPELAQALTQEQADAVRKYLVTRYAIDSTGWFSTRKVAAIGFGAQAPRAQPGEKAPDKPPRRVEIILFTPQP